MRTSFLLILCLLGTFSLNAQVPDAFQFQALVRNSSGAILTNTNIPTRFKLHQKTADGAILFVEKHSGTTDATGILNLQIGKGTAEQNSLSLVNWADGPYFMETEMDYGNGFVSTGTQQLLCVPFAKYARNAESLKLQSPDGKLWNVTIGNDGNVSAQKIQ